MLSPPRCPPRHQRGAQSHARTGQGLKDCAPRVGGTHLACRGRSRQKHQQELQQQSGRPGRRPRAHGGRPLSAPACLVTRRLCGHRVPCATRVGEPGCEARLASPPGAGFVGPSQAVRPSLPTEVFDCGSKGGKKWLRSRPRPPPPSTHQAMSLRPGHRAQQTRKYCALRGRWAQIRGKGLGDDAPKVLGPRRGRGAPGRRWGIWGCALGRRLSGVGGVASGCAQIKREARRASALEGPSLLWAPVAVPSRRSPLLNPPRTRSRRTWR